MLQAQDQTISIHALREEGDQDHRQVGSSDFISIHALREEGDDSTVGVGRQVEISIHALREEGDKRSASSRSCGAYFYPRPPRGGQPLHGVLTFRESLFLSTPSARRATQAEAPPDGGITISIHALREEGDSCKSMWCRDGAISIHALREEGDIYRFKFLPPAVISIHALREEGDITIF